MRRYWFGLLLIGLHFFEKLDAGSVRNYKIDDNCPFDVVVYDIRVSDCNELPCRIQREKWYTVEGEFGVLRNVTKPVLKCSSVYLGKHIDLPGHGGCDNLVNQTCPMIVGERYITSTTWKIPYYVPPMKYTVYCSLVDDNEENMMCGYGSSHVV